VYRWICPDDTMVLFLVNTTIMKAFHLNDKRKFLPPYSKELEQMVEVTRERSIDLSHGVVGFILGNKVLAPFAFDQSMIASKDGHDIVITHEKVDKWGISHFLLPYPIVCEPLHFRHKRIRKDTFLFRVYKQVTLSYPFSVEERQGHYGLDSPDQFCPVFDRHAHLIGINNGVFCEKLLCIPIEHLV